ARPQLEKRATGLVTGKGMAQRCVRADEAAGGVTCGGRRGARSPPEAPDQPLPTPAGDDSGRDAEPLEKRTARIGDRAPKRPQGKLSSRRTASGESPKPCRHWACASSRIAMSLGLLPKASDSRSSSSIGTSAAIGTPSSVTTSGSPARLRTEWPRESLAWVTSTFLIGYIPRFRPGVDFLV